MKCTLWHGNVIISWDFHQLHQMLPLWASEENWSKFHLMVYIQDLVQDCNNSIANTHWSFALSHWYIHGEKFTIMHLRVIRKAITMMQLHVHGKICTIIETIHIQSYDCPSANEVTLGEMGKTIWWLMTSKLNKLASHVHMSWDIIIVAASS